METSTKKLTRRKAASGVSTADKLNAFQAMAQKSLLAYAVAQDSQFALAAHVRALASKLEQVEAGKIKRLMVCMPPQHGKSLLTSEYFISWYLGRNPSHSLAYATYNTEFAERRGRSVRSLISTPQHQAIFPNCTLSRSSSAAAAFSLDQTKTGPLAFLGIGRGAGLTGYAVNGIVIDDPLKGHEEAFSATVRTSMHNWYETEVKTRIKPDDFIIVINTRWHLDDLSGYVLQNHAHENWEVVSFPALLDDEATCDLLNSHLTTGEKAKGKRFELGSALWEEQWNADYLNAIKSSSPSAVWSSLYQQAPFPADGGIINPAWFRRYTQLPDEACQNIVQSWDVGSKAKQINDPSACTTWAIYPAGAYLLDVVTKRMELPELYRYAVTHAKIWKADLVLIEDKANGTGLAQQFKDGTALPVKAIDPGKYDKTVRAQLASTLIEGGKVFIPFGEGGFLKDFLLEVASFPGSKHDDMVDSMTMFLNWFKERIKRSNFKFNTIGAPRRIANLTSGW